MIWKTILFMGLISLAVILPCIKIADKENDDETECTR